MQMEWCSFAISCFLAISFAVSLPTTTDSPEVPREFPKLDQNYTFVDNSSIRENLANHAGIDTEVDDLLRVEDILPPTNDTQPAPEEQEEDLGRKTEVEWIEDGDDTEDTKFDVSSTQPQEKTIVEADSSTSTTELQEEIIEEVDSSTQTSTTDLEEEIIVEANFETPEPYKDGVPVLDGSVAAILVGVFLVVCIFGYTGLIVWRKSLEMRYGSREMLVDKDEMYDPDDIRHFSI